MTRFVRAALVVALASASLPAAAVPAAAADAAYHVRLGGRPIDERGNSGRMHHGVAYVDLVRLTKSFAGILTFHHDDHAVLLTIGAHTATFTLGSRTVVVDGAPQTMPGAPYLENGDVFVPVATFASIAGSRSSVDTRQKILNLTAPAPPSIAAPGTPAVPAAPPDAPTPSAT